MPATIGTLIRLASPEIAQENTGMLLQSLEIPVADFEKGTGWQIRPEGACKGDICIPLPDDALSSDGRQLDISTVSETMQMPIAEETSMGWYALGPASTGGRALATAKAPDLSLPDLDGNEFRLSSLLGKKIVVYAWAPY